MHYHFTELLIFESSIGKPEQNANAPDLRRFEIYHGQLNSVKAWLNTFFTTDLRFYGDIAFFTYSELVLIMVCLHKLTILDDPAWDRSAVRKTIDLVQTLDKLISTFEQLRAAATLWSPRLGEDEAFTWAIGVFQSMKATWKDEVAGLDGLNNFLVGAQDGFLSMPTYGGDAWLSDIFSIRSNDMRAGGWEENSVDA